MPRCPRSLVHGRVPPRPLALVLPLALLLGCRTARGGPDSSPPSAPTGATPGPSAGATASETAPRVDAAEAAIEDLQEGRYREARAGLEELLLTDALTRARAALVREDPEQALLAVDEALDVAPERSEVRLLKADASLRLAEHTIAGAGSGMLIEGALSDALDYYRRADPSAHALFGASRAAWLLGDAREALDLARRGREQLGAREESYPELGLTPQRILAEPLLAAYAAARAEGAAAPELFAETEDALSALLARAVDDPWPWTRLSDLYEWEERPADARGVLERGLLRLPEDPGLLARWGRLLRTLEGEQGAVAVLERRVEAFPRLAAARWELGLARFQAALAATKAEPRLLEPSGFQRAEAEFVRTRELDPAYRQAALGYEVVCRLARGWCALWDERPADAQREFLSMNEVFEGGIRWSLPGELEDGIRGLFLVADRFNAQDQPLAAGAAFERLRELEPENPLWANNAGFFLREAAVALEREGRNLCEAAAGRIENPEVLARLRERAGLGPPGDAPAADAQVLRAAALERFERARGVMQRCRAAYEAGAALAPDDIRIVNDLALVLIYFEHEDLERAERLLQRGVAIGAEQVRAAEAALAQADESQRPELETRVFDLRSAWGDCHENLGVIRYVYGKDPAAARPWLEKAVEIGPARPPLTNSLLPVIRGEREYDDYWNLTAWATPCDPR